MSSMIQPGETMAIIRPIGSGKSTLAGNACRLLNVGGCFLDGYDIAHYCKLRSAIAYVP